MAEYVFGIIVGFVLIGLYVWRASRNNRVKDVLIVTLVARHFPDIYPWVQGSGHTENTAVFLFDTGLLHITVLDPKQRFGVKKLHVTYENKGKAFTVKRVVKLMKTIHNQTAISVETGWTDLTQTFVPTPLDKAVSA